MKLSTYARKLGISYRTAWRWFNAGKLGAYQTDTATIIVTDPSGAAIPTLRHQKIAVYTRFDFNSIEQVLAMQGRQIKIINPADNGNEDVMQDFVSIVTAFCAWLYGHPRSKRTTERIIAELQSGEESHHPSQTEPGEFRQTAQAGRTGC